MQLIFISGSLRRSSLQVALLAGSRNTFTQTFVPFSNIDNSLQYEQIDVSVGSLSGNEVVQKKFVPTIPSGYEIASISSIIDSTNARCTGSISYYSGSGYGYFINVENITSSSVSDAVAHVYIMYRKTT